MQCLNANNNTRNLIGFNRDFFYNSFLLIPCKTLEIFFYSHCLMSLLAHDLEEEQELHSDDILCKYQFPGTILTL